MAKPKTQAMAIIETMFDSKATGCWDDLNALAMDAESLMLSITKVSPILRNTELCACVPDRKGLLAAATLVDTDARAFRNELNQLKALHAGHTGGSVNPDELANTLSIGMEYTNWIERYQQTVLPNIGAILDYANEGAHIYEAKVAAAAAAETVKTEVAENV